MIPSSAEAPRRHVVAADGDDITMTCQMIIFVLQIVKTGGRNVFCFFVCIANKNNCKQARLPLEEPGH